MKIMMKICITTVCFVAFIATGCPQHVSNYFSNQNSNAPLLSNSGKGFFTSSNYKCRHKKTSGVHHPRMLYMGEATPIAMRFGEE